MLAEVTEKLFVRFEVLIAVNAGMGGDLRLRIRARGVGKGGQGRTLDRIQFKSERRP